MNVQQIVLPVRNCRVAVDDSDDDNPFGRHDDNPTVREEIDQCWESNFKLEIPEFCGSAVAEDLLDWIVTVEEILEFKRVPMDRCVALIATRFRGRAAAWWSQLKTSRARAGKQKIVSWAKLEKQLKKFFLPFNYEQILFQKFQNLRQGNRSVEEYATEFFFMTNRINLQDSTNQLIAHFVGRLRQTIQHTLNLFNPVTLAQAHQQALTIEAQTKGNSQGWSSSRSTRTTTLPLATTETTTTSTETAIVPVDTARPARQSNLRCFSCGELGHRQSVCPTRNRRGLLLDTAGRDVEVL